VMCAYFTLIFMGVLIFCMSIPAGFRIERVVLAFDGRYDHLEY
jgi:hypothetical protein